MSKTILHRLFGLGKIPKRYASTLESEGIILIDIGIGGSITLRNFRAPGQWSSWGRNWFTGCVVITERTFAAFALIRPVIYVPIDDEHLKKLDCSVKKGPVLCVDFDAGAFNEKWSGSIECQFKTPKAPLFLERLVGKAG